MDVKKAIPILVISLPLIFLFNNCSDVQFASVPSENVILGDNPTIVQVLDKCRQAELNNTLISVEQTVTFDNTAEESGRPGNICRFGEDDNLSTLNGVMRARYDQYRTLDLPTDAVICDVDMTSELQSFKYDDIFFLTFNGRILASNNKTAIIERLVPETFELESQNMNISIIDYDWLKLRDADFENVADDYCLGADEGLSSCRWPITEQQGTINFDFHPEILVALSSGVPSNNHTFGFTITGDNDLGIDCFHEKLEFKMNVKYVLKNQP